MDVLFLSSRDLRHLVDVLFLSSRDLRQLVPSPTHHHFSQHTMQIAGVRDTVFCTWLLQQLQHPYDVVSFYACIGRILHPVGTDGWGLSMIVSGNNAAIQLVLRLIGSLAGKKNAYHHVCTSVPPWPLMRKRSVALLQTHDLSRAHLWGPHPRGEADARDLPHLVVLTPDTPERLDHSVSDRYVSFRVGDAQELSFDGVDVREELCLVAAKAEAAYYNFHRMTVANNPFAFISSAQYTHRDERVMTAYQWEGIFHDTGYFHMRRRMNFL